MTTRDVGDRQRRFEAAYRRYYPRVIGYLRACRVTDSEAHDLAHDAFRKFYEKFPTIRDSEREWPFLQTIARNEFLNWLRSRKTAKRNMALVEIDSPDFTQELAAPEGPDLAEQQQTAMRRKQLYDAIAELPEGQQKAQLLWLEGKSYEEIAAELGISVDAVKSRLRDARRFLRSRLGADALPEEEQ